MPGFVPTLRTPQLFERFSRSIVVHVDVPHGRFDPRVPGELLQRERVHFGQLGPPRQAGMPKGVDHERIDFGRLDRRRMLHALEFLVLAVFALHALV